MSLQIVKGTLHIFNWINLGCNPSLQRHGIRNMSKQFNQLLGLEDTQCIVHTYPTYGDRNILFALLKEYKIDGILHFTDPRQWYWLYRLAYTIRRDIPIMYYNIWDNLPYPHFNQPYYQSCDLMMNISKQTNNIVDTVCRSIPRTKQNCVYVPHGINSDIFYSIDEDDLDYTNFKGVIGIQKQDYDLIIYANNKNIHRKKFSDIITQFSMFCETLTAQKAKRVLLLLKTNPVDNHGQDLYAVKQHLTNSHIDVRFIHAKLSQAQLNYLNNIADISINISSAQGFGLNIAQSLMSQTPVISVVTGGLQDQMRFQNEKGEWIEFKSDFPSNISKTYQKCGQWVFPLFPNIVLAGGIEVPYIYDNFIQYGQLAELFKHIYQTYDRQELSRRGKLGRQFLLGQGRMNHVDMCNSMINHISYTIDNFKPLQRIKLYNIREQLKKRQNKPFGLYNTITKKWS